MVQAATLLLPEVPETAKNSKRRLLYFGQDRQVRFEWVRFMTWHTRVKFISWYTESGSSLGTLWSILWFERSKYNSKRKKEPLFHFSQHPHLLGHLGASQGKEKANAPGWSSPQVRHLNQTQESNTPGVTEPELKHAFQGHFYQTNNNKTNVAKCCNVAWGLAESTFELLAQDVHNALRLFVTKAYCEFWGEHNNHKSRRWEQSWSELTPLGENPRGARL